MRLTLLLVAVLPVLAHDWLIVPGERVGPITANSTEASLRAAFGGAAITQAEIRIDKTATVPGIEIYRERPGESLAVVWPRKEHGLWWPLLVIACYGSTGTECRWRTASGVRVGAGVADLEKLNGKPFWIHGTAQEARWEPWWDEGKLAGQLGEDIELYFDDPGPKFYTIRGYAPSNEIPPAGRDVRIRQMFVFLLSHRRTAPANDWTIVPEERFGPIPMHAAAEPLRETLGPAQVHRGLVDGAEGIGVEPTITIFGGQADREVVLNAQQDSICGGPARPDPYKGCKWHIAGGIPLTATVEAMEKLNGRPFVFAGCCWDGGGMVESWEGGRMPEPPRRPLFSVSCEGEQPQRLSGDGVRVRSDDPDIRRQKCSVTVVDFH